MILLELINKKTKRLLSQIYKPVRIFWLQRRFNIIVCSPLLISLYIFGIEPTVTFIAYVLGNIWLLWLLVFSPIKFLLRGTEKTKNPIIKKIRAPFSMIGDALNRWNAPQKKKPEKNIDNLWGLKGTEKYWEHVENFGKVLEKKDKEFWKEDKGKK